MSVEEQALVGHAVLNGGRLVVPMAEAATPALLSLIRKGVFKPSVQHDGDGRAIEYTLSPETSALQTWWASPTTKRD